MAGRLPASFSSPLVRQGETSACRRRIVVPLQRENLVGTWRRHQGCSSLTNASARFDRCPRSGSSTTTLPTLGAAARGVPSDARRRFLALAVEGVEHLRRCTALRLRSSRRSRREGDLPGPWARELILGRARPRPLGRSPSRPSTRWRASFVTRLAIAPRPEVVAVGVGHTPRCGCTPRVWGSAVTAAALQAVHRQLLTEIYDWAGEAHRRSARRPPTLPDVLVLRSAAEQVFRQLADQIVSEPPLAVGFGPGWVGVLIPVGPRLVMAPVREGWSSSVFLQLIVSLSIRGRTSLELMSTADTRGSGPVVDPTPDHCSSGVSTGLRIESSALRMSRPTTVYRLISSPVLGLRRSCIDRCPGRFPMAARPPFVRSSPIPTQGLGGGLRRHAAQVTRGVGITASASTDRPRSRSPSRALGTSYPPAADGQGGRARSWRSRRRLRPRGERADGHSEIVAGRPHVSPGGRCACAALVVRRRSASKTGTRSGSRSAHRPLLRRVACPGDAALVTLRCQPGVRTRATDEGPDHWVKLEVGVGGARSPRGNHSGRYLARASVAWSAWSGVRRLARARSHPAQVNGGPGLEAHLAGVIMSMACPTRHLPG